MSCYFNMMIKYEEVYTSCKNNYYMTQKKKEGKIPNIMKLKFFLKIFNGTFL